ncbi:hypothetical protein [Larkinella terrae]|uniref:DUF3575 domain-containing protein n=1 Tax=Larkinella terrae TaxID=2025311 RepID=A0A7K0EER9_9BACT|nr:hypothetical protein [Larkinella terrae]MRS60314.1 hypothetical protein [Larkinella terrae]
MKKALLLLAFCLVINAVRAQDKIIKYAPLVSVGYEKVLNDKNSFYVGATIYPLPTVGITALGVKGEYRFYGLLNKEKKAPAGFWVAPTALLWYVRFNDFIEDDLNAGVGIVQLGGIAGYQFIIKNKFTIEPCLGIAGGFALGVGSEDAGIFGGAVTPVGGLRIGYILGSK